MKGKDGHVTGQETPSGQGPYGFGGVDLLPKITSLLEVTSPLVGLIFHWKPLAGGADF